MSMKNSNATIGIRTSDLPACSAVPEPNAPPRAPTQFGKAGNSRKGLRPACLGGYVEE